MSSTAHYTYQFILFSTVHYTYQFTLYCTIQWTVWTVHYTEQINQELKQYFLNQVHPKIAFVCHLVTQTPYWQLNHTFLTSSVNAVLKAMNKPFLYQVWWWSEFFYLDWKVCFCHSQDLKDWLWPSGTLLAFSSSSCSWKSGGNTKQKQAATCTIHLTPQIFVPRGWVIFFVLRGGVIFICT